MGEECKLKSFWKVLIIIAILILVVIGISIYLSEDKVVEDTTLVDEEIQQIEEVEEVNTGTSDNVNVSYQDEITVDPEIIDLETNETIQESNISN